jgi:hypothetical protein
VSGRRNAIIISYMGLFSGFFEPNEENDKENE